MMSLAGENCIVSVNVGALAGLRGFGIAAIKAALGLARATQREHGEGLGRFQNKGRFIARLIC